MKSSVSRLAIVVSASLASACATAPASHPSAAAAATPAPRAAAAPTAAEADAFVARAERELAEFSVINNRAQWVNATYITSDTDALAAYFGTIGTEMGVRSHLINDARELDPEWLSGVETVGVTAGASAPEELVIELIEKLKSYRSVTVEAVTGVQENVQFKLPPELLEARSSPRALARRS